MIPVGEVTARTGGSGLDKVVVANAIGMVEKRREESGSINGCLVGAFLSLLSDPHFSIYRFQPIRSYGYYIYRHIYI